MTITNQAFQDFENLPNLHANYHLVQHAKNYATLLNMGDECISNIILKKRIPKKKIEENFPNDSTFRKKLALIYREMGYKSAFVEDSCQHYEIGCFLGNNGTDTQYCLHIGDVVTIASEEKGDSFAILQSVFSHKKNNRHFAFIIINEFELTSQKKLECPVYRLQKSHRIYSISKVNTNNAAHFIHYCNNSECIGGDHNFRNDLYIKNMYFFKVV
ncbi:hypothetical protein F8M41_026575 [Gigaspora margarita]|uniref:Uncharacterized protein n=1 Tax=Gigaspora margarita TaxID=4874 RepID=A0A8H4AA54_GIGMA|nr:hypothetical protein F8M41_026575 [Gigaspora margarita]